MKTNLFTKIVLLLILGCLVVLVVRGITVTHKGDLRIEHSKKIQTNIFE